MTKKCNCVKYLMKRREIIGILVYIVMNALRRHLNIICIYIENNESKLLKKVSNLFHFRNKCFCTVSMKMNTNQK